MKNNKKYQAEYQYKCRLCGEIYVQEIGGWDNDSIASEMFIVTHGDSPAFDKGKIHKISPLSYHLCKRGIGFGVCDFIGIKKVEA
jgi:hypothetical protein